MRATPRAYRLWIFLCLALFALACALPSAVLQPRPTAGPQANSPGSGDTPGEGAENAAPAQSGRLLADPIAGLAGLSSYQVAFRQEVTGTLDGQPFERHTSIELTHAALSNQFDFTRQLQASQRPATYLRVIGAGQALYRWDLADDVCQGWVGEHMPEDVIEPARLLLPVYQGTQVATETVNAVEAVHYRFDQDGLPLAEPKEAVSGDVWIAVQGGYVVKYVLNAPAPAAPTGKGLETAQTWTYELSRVNAIESISLPDQCMPVPVDIPAMPDAQELKQSSGWSRYTSASSADQIVDFYAERLPALGWSAAQAGPAGEIKLPYAVSYENAGRKLTLNIDQAEPTGLQVSLVMRAPVEKTALPGEPPAETPGGPQPTIDPAASGLPDDVPLYPGATGLYKYDLVIMFDVPTDPDTVAAFYAEKMPAAQWSLVNALNQPGQILQIWQKDDRTLTVIVSSEAGKTSVMISKTP